MAPPCVVLDTNVLVSALLFHRGSVAWLRRAWQAEAIRPLVCRETAEELIRVLAYPKFRLSDADCEDLLGDVLPWCETVTVPQEIEAPPCRNPADRAFLALAIAANADALITGDGDLLDLAGTCSVQILTPADFRERLAGTVDDRP